MIKLAAKLEDQQGLKITAVRNEERGLNVWRIRKVKLDVLVDSSISSCFVYVCYPEADIVRLALDIARVPAQKVVYIENTLVFAEVHQGLCIQGSHHSGMDTTQSRPETLELK